MSASAARSPACAPTRSAAGHARLQERSIYPLAAPNLTRAKALAYGQTRGGKACSTRATAARAPAIAQIVQYNLRQIGIDVEIKQFARAVQFEKAGTRASRST